MIGILAAALQTLYADHGNPTAAEQRVLEIVNRARVDPTAEGVRLAIPGGITEGLTGPEAADVGPRPPLAMNVDLLAAARLHSLDMRTRAFFAHVNPDGDGPGDRIGAAGYPFLDWSENIVMSTGSTAEELGDALMIDDQYAGRGHRKALLDINPGSSTYMREIGIGHHAAATGVVIPPNSSMWLWKDFLTQDFGYSATQPFLLGVAYLDANNNSFYDEGEGLGGVSVVAAGGAFYAVTASAGGYAFPTASSGDVTVTGAGSNLPDDILTAVTLTTANRKVDFRVGPQPDGDADGLPDFWESRFPTAGLPGADTDGDSFTNLQEFRGGSDPTAAGSTPAPPPSPPPPPAAPSDDDDDDGGCGATGVEAAAVALLLSWRSRRRREV